MTIVFVEGGVGTQGHMSTLYDLYAVLFVLIDVGVFLFYVPHFV